MHSEDAIPFVGAYVQDQGMETAINEITEICSRVAIIVSQFAKMPDMFDKIKAYAEKDQT